MLLETCVQDRKHCLSYKKGSFNAHDASQGGQAEKIVGKQCCRESWFTLRKYSFDRQFFFVLWASMHKSLISCSKKV